MAEALILLAGVVVGAAFLRRLTAAAEAEGDAGGAVEDVTRSGEPDDAG